MLNSFPVAAILSTALGFLAGLGVGGGSLLMLWLTLVVGISQPEARVYNLIFFIPTAIISSLFRKKQGTLPLKLIWPAILAGCLFAALFTFWGRQWELALVKKLFGGLLLVTGIRELLYKPKKH